MNTIRIFICGLLLASSFNATAQNIELDKKTSKFIIKGTSSLHDWEMVSETCQGSIALNNVGTESLDIKNINIAVEVETLKSGKNIMDKKCYRALKHDEFPVIKYHFKNITSIERKNDNLYSAKLNGTLSIAGITKPTLILVDIILKDNIIVNIKGKKELKMSDFNVVPPTALLGTLKTGNDITIEFNLNYI